MDFETEVTPVPENEESQHVYEERCFICNHQCYSKPPSPSSTPNHSLAKWAVETRESVYEAFDIQVDPSFFQGTQGELPICPSCSFTVGRMKVVQKQLHDLQSLYDRIRAEIAFSIVDVVANSGGAKHHLMNIGNKSPTSLLNAFRECEAETLQQLIFESWHDRNSADTDDSSLTTNKNRFLKKNFSRKISTNSDVPPTLDSHISASSSSTASTTTSTTTKDSGINESSKGKTNFSGLTTTSTTTTRDDSKDISSNNTSKESKMTTTTTTDSSNKKELITDSKKQVNESNIDDHNDDKKENTSTRKSSISSNTATGQDREDDKNQLEIVEVTPVEGEEDEGAEDDDDDVREIDADEDDEEIEEGMTNGNLASSVTITMSPQYCEDGYSSTEFINENSEGEMEFDEDPSTALEITEWGGSSNGSAHHGGDEELEHDDFEDIIFEDSSMDNIVSNHPGSMVMRRKSSSCGIRDSLEITQNEEGLYVCMFCSKTFIHKYPYRDHLKTHTGEGPRCEVCNKIFPKNHNLMLHMRTHTGEKPYVCEVCNKGFADKSNLKVHMRVHTGERPYKCEFCDQAFVNSSRLVVHRRLHTGEKPFPCTLCSRTFSTGSQLQAHQKMHYSGKPFSCDECGKGYSSNSSLQSHKNLYHGV